MTRLGKMLRALADKADGHDGEIAGLEARLAAAEYDTGWENVYYVSDSFYIKARRVGKQVTVIGFSEGKYEIAAGSYSKVTTLSAKFRPSMRVDFVKHSVGGSPRADSNYIGTDGVIMMYTKESGNSYWAFSVSYPVG